MTEAISTAIAGLIVAITALLWSYIQHRQIKVIEREVKINGKGKDKNGG